MVGPNFLRTYEERAALTLNTDSEKRNIWGLGMTVTHVYCNRVIIEEIAQLDILMLQLGAEDGVVRRRPLSLLRVGS